MTLVLYHGYTIQETNKLTSDELNIDNFIGLTFLNSAILGMDLQYFSVNIRNV